MVAVFDNRNIDIKDVAITQYRRTLDLTKISIFTDFYGILDFYRHRLSLLTCEHTRC
ncbi:Uncharacterised protein [Vibrio cholerae]|nr:Uncharacterised protein [Vibrio cholerae]